ncbi:MAG: arylsulfatase [Bacteroidota bacterium]
MNRKTILTNVVMVMFCIFQYLSVSGQTDQPNIIFILADDLSYRDLSCYGQKRYQTPNLDGLARSGIRFTQAYAAAPECAPSRAALLTGLHTGRGRIRTNSSARGQEHLHDEDLTIAEVLKEAGYNTGFTGKWGVGLPGTEGLPYKQGFDYCFGYYDQSRAHTFIPDYLWENDTKVFYPENKGFEMNRRYDYSQVQNTYDEEGKLYIEELEEPYKYAYSQNEIEVASLQFIDEHHPQKTGAPFFLYFATQLPHGPVITDRMEGLSCPDTVSQTSCEWGAMVVQLDEYVGQLMAYLKDNNLYDNTILFFASDNGYSMCGYTLRGNGPDWPDDPWLQNKGPFTGGKFSVLEGGCRVPFFVSCPAKYKPAVYSDPVWLPDFFPTAISLAGLEANAYDHDGKSLLPFMEGQSGKFKAHEYLYFSKGAEQAVRMGPWKAYRKNYNAPMELYLIEEDTYTQQNLAHLYPNVVKKVEDIMEKEHKPTKWYRNPKESQQEYQAKKLRAIAEGEVLPKFRPNGIKRFPWEK